MSNRESLLVLKPQAPSFPAASSWPDFIEQFMLFSDGMPSPRIYRQWSGIALVAGACERRVWTQTGPFVNYLNLYTLLVGAPGTGKYIIEQVKLLWDEAIEPSGTKAFYIAPDSMSKASLMDQLDASKKTFLPAKGPPLEYHSLMIAAEEFSVLMPGADAEYSGALNGIWNNPAVYKERRRTSVVKNLTVEFPQLNLLGGIQPQFLSLIAPEETWNTGLARRVIMVFAGGKTKPVDLRRDYSFRKPLRASLLAQLSHMSQLYGELNWEPEAFDKFHEWFLTDDKPPKPSHSKLEHYCNTREQFVMKLVGVSAISRGSSEIQLPDLTRAWDWLFEAEALMPDIFRAQLGKSDSSVMEELMIAMHKFQSKQRSSIPSSLLYSFLLKRVPDYKIVGILSTMEKSGMIKQVDETLNLWQVEPKYEKMTE